MPHYFRVTLEALDQASGKPLGRQVHTDIVNHDDLFDIIAKISARRVVFAHEATEFAIGLKLFTEVMLRHREDALFAELLPHIGAFMKRLKSAFPAAENCS